MTTIAYRDGVLAADTLSCSNGLRDDHGPKIWRVGKVLVGASGSRALCLKFRAWVADGMNGESPWDGKDEGNGLVASEAGVVCWSYLGCWPVRGRFYALGSGYQVAVGAMEHGASAQEAVQAAMAWDTGTGGEVMSFSLREPPHDVASCLPSHHHLTNRRDRSTLGNHRG